MDDLNTLRKKIDEIDKRLVKTLNKRAGLGQKIASIKHKTNSPVFLPARERDILKSVAAENKGPLSNESLGCIFREIFSATRAVEKPITVSFLGPEGSFSHLASLKLFGSSCQRIFETGIDMVFSDVEKERADFGVVPIENSIEGTVGQTHDLLIKSPVKIYAETYFEIHINLLSNASGLKNVKTLYTHYMPLGQCRRWVSQNLPGVKIVEMSSTAAAAKKAAASDKSAALGAYEAAGIYKLGILAEKIEERQGNQTRFLVISLKDSPENGAEKTSIVFSIKDEAGALSEILRPFSVKNLNLSKIHSRPSPEKGWEYVFFVDFDGNASAPEAQWVLKKIKPLTIFLKNLGSYPDGRV